MSAVIEQRVDSEPPAKREKSAYERLKRRHRRFVDQVVMGITGSEAIRSVGCKSQHANSIAARWMQRPYIRAAIEEREAQVAYDVGIRQHKVLRQMLAIATCDPRKLIDPETRRARRLEELDEATAAAISSVEVEDISTGGETGTRYKYRFWDKVKANDRLGQFTKLWDAKSSSTSINVDARSVTVNNGDGAAAAAAIQSVLRLGAQLAQGRPAIGAEASGADGSVLPAEVPAEPAGRGASVVVGADSGRPEGA